jgi:hypothetical protein
MWDITRQRSTIVNKVREISNDIAALYWRNPAIDVLKEGYLPNRYDDWVNEVFKTGKFEAHHIIPIDVLEQNEKLQKLMKWAKDNGKLSELDFNSIDNGIMIAKKNLRDEIPGHSRHDAYSQQINTKLDGLIETYDYATFNKIKVEISKIRQQLIDDVVTNNKNVNDLILR